jgi:RNA polymerase sigma-70 factor, ECF subfamily
MGSMPRLLALAVVDDGRAAPRAVADPDATWIAQVVAAGSGDRRSMGALFERFAPLVHGVLIARVRRAEADDLVHDVFMTAMRGLSLLREPAAFPGWLATIARNRATDFLRARKPSASDVDPDQLVDTREAPSDDRREAERVLRIIRSLPEAYRETLTLRLVEGLTGAEIADSVGLTHESVRVNLHRGMKLLRERLEAPEGAAR